MLWQLSKSVLLSSDLALSLNAPHLFVSSSLSSWTYAHTLTAHKYPLIVCSKSTEKLLFLTETLLARVSVSVLITDFTRGSYVKEKKGRSEMDLRPILLRRQERMKTVHGAALKLICSIFKAFSVILLDLNQLC